MAKTPVLLLALLALTALPAGPAFAGKEDKKAKEAEIKALEEQIRDLQQQEKGVLKGIDARFEYILRCMDPKEIHRQLEEILVVLREVSRLLTVNNNFTPDHLNYDGYRHKAHESIERADQQIEKALAHDTAEERARAAHDIGVVREDVLKALTFSLEHPADVDGTSKEELERRAEENKRLKEALPRIEEAHHLLMAVDHEIADYKEEKAEVIRKRDGEKKEVKDQFHAKYKELEEKIAALKK